MFYFWCIGQLASRMSERAANQYQKKNMAVVFNKESVPENPKKENCRNGTVPQYQAERKNLENLSQISSVIYKQKWQTYRMNYKVIVLLC